MLAALTRSANSTELFFDAIFHFAAGAIKVFV